MKYSNVREIKKKGSFSQYKPAKYSENVFLDIGRWLYIVLLVVTYKIKTITKYTGSTGNIHNFILHVL